METEPGKILVVDDNEMNRDLLSRRLAKRGHIVEVAEDGQQALNLVESGSFDLVLLDIMMPGIDGYEVLQQIRKVHNPSDLPVIMATALEKGEDVVKALKMGANDYVTKPLDMQVVLARVQTQLSVKNSRDALVAAHTRMKNDLEAAARFQRALLPTEEPASERFQFAWRFAPCTELGGDALNVFAIDEHHICFFLLDVAGHGVPSALLSVSVTQSLSVRPPETSPVIQPSEMPPGYRLASPAEICEHLNRQFPMATNNDQYFTAAIAMLDTDSASLKLVSAGHPGPLHISKSERPRAIESANFPIGMISEADFREDEIKLSAGDRLYLYSDGLNEAENADGERFEIKRLLRIAESTSEIGLDESLDAIIGAVQDWQGKDTFDDDISIIAIEARN